MVRELIGSTKWDMRFLEEAKQQASYSKDPSTKVGAVIYDFSHRKPVSSGYNGFPRRMRDDDRLNDRDKKYQIIVHAEINAIIHGDRDKLEGSTLYTYPFLPCARCAGIVVQAGIARVVSFNTEEERWLESIDLGKTIMRESGIVVIEYDCKLKE